MEVRYRRCTPSLRCAEEGIPVASHLGTHLDTRPYVGMHSCNPTKVRYRPAVTDVRGSHSLQMTGCVATAPHSADLFATDQSAADMGNLTVHSYCGMHAGSAWY